MTILYHAESDALIKEWDGFDHDSADGALCTPVPAYQLKRGERVSVGFHYAEVLADMDFETYSEAGFVWLEDLQRWQSVNGKGKSGGLSVVGAPAYSEHPSTEVVSLAYNLKDGLGERLWLPGMPPPKDLFNFIAAGGLVEAHNSGFEWLIWHNVCFSRMGWPVLPLQQLRCSASKCRAFGMPGALAKAAFMLELNVQKDKKGSQLIKRFSVPHTPTKKEPYKRILPEHDPVGAAEFVDYNIVDIRAEAELSAHVPDLNPTELQAWLVDQNINMRGVALDVESMQACIAIYEQRVNELNQELRHITAGQVSEASKVQDTLDWLLRNGLGLGSLDEESVSEALSNRDRYVNHVVRVLEIRQEAGLTSVKKLYAMRNRLSYDNRLRDLFVYSGAERTGRYSGQGPQPQNLPSSGPEMRKCEDVNCGAYFATHHESCPCCGAPSEFTSGPHGWGPDVAESILAEFRKAHNWSQQNNGADVVGALTHQYGNIVKTISGCLRGLFVAAPGKDLICSDYSAIEAVVLAALAGEQWRLDVFHTHGRIYEASASQISGVPFEEMMAYKGYDMSDPKWWLQPVDGPDHPLRKKLGKFAELASGYQGNLGAWKAFGADKHMTDQEIKDAVKLWREKSPMIVKFWYAMEDCAISAVHNPEQVFSYRGISWCYRDKVLYCQLLSGRMLCYQKAFTREERTPWGQWKPKLYYYGTDEQSKVVLLDTYGGKLVENITQATARDIMSNALVNLDARGYGPVLHVHDEPCGEVPEGWGSVQEFEQIMCQLPRWAQGWPIKASGGWRGKRYRKD